MKIFAWALFTHFFLNYSLLVAQPHDFGDVPIEQLEMEYYEKDSSASAVVLFDKGQTLIDHFNNEFNVIFKRHVRIKVLTDEGLTYGDIAIPYREGEPEQTVSRVKAVSYNLDDRGKVVKTNLGRRDKHNEEIDEYWSELKFSLPDLRKGSVFEYSYELHSNDPMDFPDWYFQREIPTVWSGLITQIPEWFNYETVRRGYHFYAKNEQRTYQDRLMIGYGADSYTVDFEGQEYEMVMTDIPGLYDEPFMKSSIDYLAHMRFRLATIKMPNSPISYYMGSWQQVKNTLLNDEDLGERLKYSDKIDQLISTIPKPDSLTNDYLKSIYNLISQEIKWNNRIGLYAYEDLEKTIKNREGSATSINLLLVQALRQAGFDAYPLTLSTRGNGRVITNLPTLATFDLTLACVKIDDERIVLDARYKDKPYDIMPVENMNGSGLIIQKGNVEWVPIENLSKNKITKFITINLDSAGAHGEIEAKYFGTFAMDIHANLNNDDSLDIFLDNEFSVPGDSKISLENKSGNLMDGVFEIKSTFETEWNDKSLDIRYFNPTVTEQIEINPFSSEERNYPIDFNYIFDKNVIVNIIIPENWEIAEVPESILHRLPERAGEFRRITQIVGNKIVVNYRLRINKDSFMPDKYETVKELYEKMVTSLAENIVLKKVS
jgi:hypothetical protein